MEFGLIIQQTIAGLSDQYVSDHLIALRNTSEILESTTDERMVATKLSNQSDVYAVQLTTNFRVYSLIVTNVSDFVGGAGFYAIRLYTPKAYPLDNFQRILDEIKNRYLEYQSRNVSKSNQDYSPILTSIMSVVNNKQEFVCLKGKGEGFLYFEPNDVNLGTFLNSKGVYLFNKVYGFNKEQAVQPSVAVSLGLSDFEEYLTAKREVVISDKQLLIKELKINDQSASVRQSATEFFVLCRNSDRVTYNTIDDKDFRPIAVGYVSIERKHVSTPKPVSYGQQRKPSNMFKPGGFAVVVIMVVMLGVGIWYLFLHDPKSKEKESVSMGSTTQTTVDSIHADSQSTPRTYQPITFVLDSTDRTERNLIYKTYYPKLEKYRFKFVANRWLYKNTKSMRDYKRFSAQTLVGMSTQDTLDFSEIKIKEFLDALQSLSGHHLERQTIPKPTTANDNEPKNPSEIRSNSQDSALGRMPVPTRGTDEKTRMQEQIK